MARDDRRGKWRIGCGGSFSMAASLFATRLTATSRAVAMDAGRPAAMRLRQPANKHRASAFGPAAVLALKLVATALAGAAITLLLWSTDWASLLARQPERSVMVTPSEPQEA